MLTYPPKGARAGRGYGRRKAHQQSGDQGQDHRKTQNSKVDGQSAGPVQVAGRQPQERANREECNGDPSQSSRTAEHGTFGEHLTGDPDTSGPDGAAYGEFVLSRRESGQ